MSFECLRSLTLRRLCPSAVPLPQYECIVSKPQTFEAPLTLITCRCALLVASAAARSKHGKKQKKKYDKNMQPVDPKDLSLSRSHQLSHSSGSVCQAGPHNVAVVSKVGKLPLSAWLCKMLICLPQ